MSKNSLFSPQKNKEDPTFRARQFVFTLNNYTPEELEHIKNPHEDIRYYAYSFEVGEEGTPHLQGYVVVWKKVSIIQLKRTFLRRAHFEVMRGTLEDSKNYCSKQADLIEFGSRPCQGRRADLIDVKRKLEQGQDVMDIAMEEQHFSTVMRHERFFNKVQNHIKRKKIEKARDVPDVYLRIGPTGTGKTRWLDDTFGPGKWAFVPDNTGKWFDDCHNYDVVCFDDVKVNEIPPISWFKKLIDRYPLNVPIKGGFAPWKPKVIVITSNSAPSQWWPDASSMDLDAIARRIGDNIEVIE